MRLIDDDSDLDNELPAPDEPPALEPPTASRANGTATHVETQRSSPPLIRWIVAAVILIILAFLILLLARWIYHKAHHHTLPAPAASQQTSQNSGLNTQPPQNPQAGGSNSNGSKSSGSASLPNNGPGNVADLFVISTVAAAGIHYTVRSRRLNN